MKILLVEDEVALSNAVKKILEHQGYLVDAVYTGNAAVGFAGESGYSLIILDVMLPELDGFEVVQILRKKHINTPVLMLTARTAISDKVKGLNFGADDYMAKPFDPDELVARVGALTRRRGDVILNKIGWEDLTLDINSAVLSCGDESVQLSRKEFDVMKIFFYNPKMTVTNEMLIADVWGIDSDATDNNVEVYISFLRKKLKYLGSNVTIKKQQKLGYRMEVCPC